MAVVVIGGHSRSVGKTSIVCGLIARLPRRRWTAVKVTQFGHGFCSADGSPCACQTEKHSIAISQERDPGTGTDTSRFLAAGARKSIWVRARRGRLIDALPRILKEIDRAEDIIFESNSLVEMLQPDLYLAALDYATKDFKSSARRSLDRTDALLVRGLPDSSPWEGISSELISSKLQFPIAPPDYVTDALASFVEERVRAAPPLAASIRRM